MADPATAGAPIVPLSQGFGYGIIVGLGFAFALGMITITWALKRYHGEVCAAVISPAYCTKHCPGANLRRVLDCWSFCEIWPCGFCSRIELDLGRYFASVF